MHSSTPASKKQGGGVQQREAPECDRAAPRRQWRSTDRVALETARGSKRLPRHPASRRAPFLMPVLFLRLFLFCSMTLMTMMIIW